MTGLDEVVEQLDYALVGPRDSRIHVIETGRHPFSAVCHLGRDFGDGVLRGCSGVLVGPRLVLTAGHCLYSHRRRAAPRRILVSPGRRDRDTFPFGRITARTFYVPRAYKGARSASGRRNNDFGVIVLPSRFLGIRRIPPVKALTEAEIARLKGNGLVGVAGYPADRPTGTMWYHMERLTGATARRLSYTVDTCPGHSGSAVWVTRKGTPDVSIVGVHTSGILDPSGRSYGCRPGTVLAPSNRRNGGVRISPAAARVLRRPSPAAFRSIGLVRS